MVSAFGALGDQIAQSPVHGDETLQGKLLAVFAGQHFLPEGVFATRMIDTLALAKARFPGMPNSLDALCRRFAIDLSARTTHNALLDCRLLAEVYVELTGGRQRGLSLAADKAPAELIVYTHAGNRTPRPMVPSAAELAAHAGFVARLKDSVWSSP